MSRSGKPSVSTQRHQPADVATPMSDDSGPRPVLLTLAKHFQTLAAARHLGGLGIPVTMADSTQFWPAMWSESVTRRETAPRVHDTEEYLAWLLEFGSKNPGYVLYPTTDETAWLFSRYQDQLSKYYRMYSPSFECIYRLLNKQRLTEACIESGIAVPETHFPKSLCEVEQLSASITYPVLIKPKTQGFLINKGSVIYDSSELLSSYKEYMDVNTYPDEAVELDPTIQWPMVQSYYPEAMEGIYSISGFIDITGNQYAVRASRKILQHPRRVGIGLCFEEAEVDECLLNKVISLCRKLNYYGVFEVEFIKKTSEDCYVLTDFNPRYYNQMQFDIDRGLLLPELTYYGALGDIQRLQQALDCSQNLTVGQRTYCYAQKFRLTIKLQQLSRSMTRADARRWRCWFAEHQNAMSDPIANNADRRPGIVNALLFFKNLLSYPKWYLRSVVFHK